MFRELWYRIKDFFLSLRVDDRETRFPESYYEEDPIDWDDYDSDWNVIPDAIEVDEPKKKKAPKKKRKVAKKVRKPKKAAKHK